MPDAPFDRDTEVRPDGAGRWRADLTEGWAVGAGLNGGYLLGVVGRALGRAAEGKPDPVTVSATYLSASRPGPAVVDVAVRRDGGSTAVATAELTQEEDGEQRPRVLVLATCADLDRLPDDVRTTATPPRLPPPRECVPAVDAPRSEGAPPPAPMLSRLDLRFPADGIGWARGAPSGRGRLGAWVRLEGDREPDALSLLTICDVLPPVTFDLGIFGWAPTLELTVHVRARPVPGWLRVHHATRNLAGGMFEEDCEIWDEADRLVAQSRQLALLPR